MNFRDEYKKSAESISPDRKAIDRMKSAVLAKLADEQGSFPDIQQNPCNPEKTSGRKPLLLKRVALIGGAVAACAVITVSAVTLLPGLNSSKNMLNEFTSSTAAAESSVNRDEQISNDGSDAGYAQDSTDPDPAPGVVENFSPVVPEAAEITESSKDGEVPAITDAVPEFDDFSAQEITPATGKAPSLPEIGHEAPEEAVVPDTNEEYFQDDDEVVLPVTGADEPQSDTSQNKENSGNAGIHPLPTEEADVEIITDEADAADIMTGEVPSPEDDRGNPMTGAPDDFVPEENAVSQFTDEIWMDETLDAEEEEEEEYIEPKLILSDKGWLNYDSKRYDLDSSVTAAMFPLSPVTVTNVLDGKDYFLYINGYVIKVFDGDRNFLGLYRLRV